MSAREERLVTPQTIAAVDQWLDEAEVFAKGYWQYVDGKLTTVGLRIGQDWDKVVAFFGDTVVRHEDGSHTVLSAKDAAELARLRAERHETNEALDDAVRELRVQQDRIAELESRVNAVAEYATSRVTGPEANNEASASWVLHLLAVDSDSQNPIRPCGCPKRFDRHAWGCPTVPEDRHESELHHAYELGRDLPFIPAQTTGHCPRCRGTFEDCTCGGGA